MSRFAELASNTDGEISGVWKTWRHVSGKTISFLLARAGGNNDAFRIGAEKVTRPFRKSGIDVAELAPSVQDEITRELYARHVVKDWKGTAVDGIPYSAEACIELFTVNKDAFTFVLTEAQSAANYASAGIESEAGN